jgi:hypothetical protein
MSESGDTARKAQFEPLLSRSRFEGSTSISVGVDVALSYIPTPQIMRFFEQVYRICAPCVTDWISGAPLYIGKRHSNHLCSSLLTLSID